MLRRVNLDIVLEVRVLLYSLGLKHTQSKYFLASDEDIRLELTVDVV